MARYKIIDRNPKLIPVVLDAQLMPGSFEYALDFLVDNELDLSRFDARYKNDETGAPAYSPAVMIKIILLAYSRGLNTSRDIERVCRESVLFMAISGDSAPQFSTIAKFVRELGTEVASLFTQVLLTCDAEGLIGRQMFAIDGVKLPSNASKHRSGTKAELAHDAERMEKAVAKMVKAHQSRDSQIESALSTQEQAKQQKYQDKLSKEAQKIRNFLAENEERTNAKGKPIKSNVTDNESAKMATAKGVIQGYSGVAAVDSQHQIIVAAKAYGTGNEQSTLLPTIHATDKLRTDQTLITADAGYHSADNIWQLHEENIPALIADGRCENAMSDSGSRPNTKRNQIQLPIKRRRRNNATPLRRNTNLVPKILTLTRKKIPATARLEKSYSPQEIRAQLTAAYTLNLSVTKKAAAAVRNERSACIA